MLSEQQIKFYHTNGYLGVDNVLSAAEVAELQRVTDEFVEKSREVVEHTEVFDLEPGHSVETPRLRRLKNPARLHPTYTQILHHERILDIVEQLIGPGVRLFPDSDVLNMKLAGFGSAVGWHQDWAFGPFSNDDLLDVGIAIDDMTMENGALMVIPGSHKGPIYSHHQNGTFVGAVSEADLRLDDAVPIEVKAGGISIHHTRVLHASARNVSDRSRRLLIVEYCALDNWPLMGIPNWDTWNASIMRGEPTVEPRLAPVPARVPFPKGERSGSIYEVQTMLEEPVLGTKAL